MSSDDATLDAFTGTTDANGIAQVHVTFGKTAGTVQVTASWPACLRPYSR